MRQCVVALQAAGGIRQPGPAEIAKAVLHARPVAVTAASTSECTSQE